MNLFLAGAAVLIFLLALFVFVPARVLASALKSTVPAGLILLGAGLSLMGRVGLGSVLLFAGLALWRRFRGVGTFGSGRSQPSDQQRSSVRSAAIEMVLDHDSGDCGCIWLERWYRGDLGQLGSTGVAS